MFLHNKPILCYCVQLQEFPDLCAFVGHLPVHFFYTTNLFNVDRVGGWLLTNDHLITSHFRGEDNGLKREKKTYFEGHHKIAN